MSIFHRAAEWVRRHYQAIILTALVVGFATGAATTAPGRALQPYTQALTFFMILFISFTITPRQFLTVSRQPWPVLAGLGLNFLFMPLLAWGLARLLVNNPDFAVGLILVGVVPCAGMAAVWTALLKGDVPLSMAINALTMVLGPFLIPFSMALLAGADVAISAWGMFQQLAIILLAPLALGVGLRWLSDRLWNTQPILPLLPALSALTAVLLMFTVTNLNAPLIMKGQALTAGFLIAVILYFPIGFLLPHWLGRTLFAWPQRVAVTYAAGMKNLPIAVGLAFASFPGQPLIALPVALAFIAQMITASLFYRYLLGRAPQPQVKEQLSHA